MSATPPVAQAASPAARPAAIVSAIQSAIQSATPMVGALVSSAAASSATLDSAAMRFRYHRAAVSVSRTLAGPTNMA
jgi:hypothetical protein